MYLKLCPFRFTAHLNNAVHFPTSEGELFVNSIKVLYFLSINLKLFTYCSEFVKWRTFMNLDT